MNLLLLQIYLAGIVILLGAIIVNVIAKKVGLLTWYDFLVNPREITFISGIFLFGIYPLLLGLLGYVGLKIVA